MLPKHLEARLIPSDWIGTNIVIAEERSDGDWGLLAAFKNTDEQLSQLDFITMSNICLVIYFLSSENRGDIHWWDKEMMPDYTEF